MHLIKFIIPGEVTDSINLDKTEFSIFVGSDVKKQTLYNKEDDLLLGNILVSTGSHLFMADIKKSKKTIQTWMVVLLFFDYFTLFFF